MDKKICPLTKADCYGCECALCCNETCSLVALTQAVCAVVTDIYWIRKELENK